MEKDKAPFFHAGGFQRDADPLAGREKMVPFRGFSATVGSLVFDRAMGRISK
jgi:hypothetical protein